MVKHYTNILNEGFSNYFKKLDESMESIYTEYSTMSKDPILEFPNGDYYYVAIDPETATMWAGDATNVGITKDLVIDIDEEGTLESNLQKLYDTIIEENPSLIAEELAESAEPDEYEESFRQAIIDWMYDHSQALRDIQSQMGVRIEDVSLKGLKNWIAEHNQLKQDFNNFFAYDLDDDLEVYKESLNEERSSVIPVYKLQTYYMGNAALVKVHPDIKMTSINTISYPSRGKEKVVDLNNAGTKRSDATLPQTEIKLPTKDGKKVRVLISDLKAAYKSALDPKNVSPDDLKEGFWDDEDEPSDWKRIDRKSVKDWDDFYTDYSLYYNEADGRYVCIFGDTDIYTPENSDYDMEFDNELEAREWFDTYRGAEEDFDESLAESEDRVTLDP